MKKYTIIFFSLILLLGAAGTVSAQLFDPVTDEGMGLRAGLSLAYVPYYITETTPEPDIDISINQMELGLFIDSPFVRFSGNYGFSLSASAGGADVPDFSRQYIDLSLIGKYPLMLGGISLWPALGAAYNIVTAYDVDGDGVDELDDFTDINDFYIQAGLGADFLLARRFIITPSILFGYNLTPAFTVAGDAAETEATIYRLNVGVGIGFAF